MKDNWLNKFYKSLIFYFLIIVFITNINAQSDTIQTNVPALKDVYIDDFYIGCLLSYRHVGFSTDPYVQGQSSVISKTGGHLIKFHMNSMSPGNNMKPQYTVDINASAAAYNSAATQEAKDSINIHPKVRFNGDLIAQLNWAKRQGFTFRGHTLVWYNQTPGTAFFRQGYTSSGTYLTKEKMTERMDSYIKEVIRLIHESWPGMMSAIDVVNEAVNENGTDRTNNNEWYTVFGDNSYIMKAFEITRKYTTQFGEPQIKLYYNDYNTSSASKANGIVRICTSIFQAGYLDGIGMQEHDANTTPTAQQWITSYDKFSPICTEMAITELDVNPGSGTPTAAALKTQANQYSMLFKCFVERSFRSGRGKIINVSKDGLNDEMAFVKNASLWDSNNQCKQAFYAAANTGLYYNILDSLIKYANRLIESEYTSESWSNLSTTLASSINAKEKNYSASISAADELGKAKDDLAVVINNLIRISTGVEGNNYPKEFLLSQNYPNPFNPETKIEFSVPHNSFISLKVLNLLGEEIQTLFEGVKNAGNHSVKFDGSGLTSGIYLYQMKSGNFMETKKLVLIR